MAKTLLYLQENGLTDLDELDAALADAHEKVTSSRANIKAIEQTLKEKKEHVCQNVRGLGCRPYHGKQFQYALAAVSEGAGGTGTENPDLQSRI